MFQNSYKQFICLAALVFTIGLMNASPSYSDDLSCRESLGEWSRCESDADCVVIPDICNSVIAATSASHREDAQSCNRALGRAASCPVIGNPQALPPMKAVCQQGQCKAVSAVP